MSVTEMMVTSSNLLSFSVSILRNMLWRYFLPSNELAESSEILFNSKSAKEAQTLIHKYIIHSRLDRGVQLRDTHRLVTE